jgi:integrase
MRRGLGLKFNMQASILHQFDRFIAAHQHQGQLTQALALRFAGDNRAVSPSECARRYQVVRHFSNYLATFDTSTPKLDPRALTKPIPRTPPYVLTEKEMKQLLDEAQKLSSKIPLRGLTIHTILGLAVSTGLRIGEVVRLDKNDVDFDNCILTIRQTKFSKDRLVPFHHTTCEILRNYAGARDIHFSDHSPAAFFLNLRGRRFATSTLEKIFAKLTRRVGLRDRSGKRPTFHSLRHSFAVWRLVAWYRNDQDVQALLPVLATYMGHVEYRSTTYYLTATAELLQLASERHQLFLKQCEVWP